jgi:peptide chain release factor 3
MKYPKFDRQDYLDGKLQPVFFWFCIEQFWSQEIIGLFCSNCSFTKTKDSETRLVDPKEENVWICFKIHANMDPKHRDRLAL